VVEQLRNYVNFAKGAGGYRQEGVIYDYSFPKKSGELFTIEGTFDWEMPCTSGATLSIYDNKGKMLLCIFTDVLFSKGLHTYKYSITDPAFKSGETYWMRLTACNYRVKEIAITMD
jgi:hypothetical protein